MLEFLTRLPPHLWAEINRFTPCGKIHQDSWHIKTLYGDTPPIDTFRVSGLYANTHTGDLWIIQDNLTCWRCWRYRDLFNHPPVNEALVTLLQRAREFARRAEGVYDDYAVKAQELYRLAYFNC